MGERPDRSLREIHRLAQFINLRDTGRNRHRIGLGERLKLLCLRGNGISAHAPSAAEHPDQWDEGRAGDNGEDECVELELADALNEVVLGRQQQYAGAISFAEGELRQPEQVALALVIT